MSKASRDLFIALVFGLIAAAIAVVLLGPPLHAQPNVGGFWSFTQENPNGRVCNPSQAFIYMPSGAIYTCVNGIEKLYAGGGGGGGGGFGVCPISFAAGAMTFPSAATGNTGGTPCNVYTLTLSTEVSASSPATNPAGMTAGQTYAVILTQPSGGGVVLDASSGPSNFLNFPTTTVPYAANSVTVYGCFWTGSSCAPVPTATTAAYGTAASVAFASVPSTCPANVPQEVWINDSTVNTIGSAITTGGGSYLVYAVCFTSGGNWIVVGTPSAGGSSGIPYCAGNSGSAGAAYVCSGVATSPSTGSSILFHADAANPGTSLSTLNTGNGAKAIAGTSAASCLALATIEPIILVYSTAGGGQWVPGLGMPCLSTTLAAYSTPFVGQSVMISLPNSTLGTQAVQEAGSNFRYFATGVPDPVSGPSVTAVTTGSDTLSYAILIWTASGPSLVSPTTTITNGNLGSLNVNIVLPNVLDSAGSTDPNALCQVLRTAGGIPAGYAAVTYDPFADEQLCDGSTFNDTAGALPLVSLSPMGLDFNLTAGVTIGTALRANITGLGAPQLRLHGGGTCPTAGASPECLYAVDAGAAFLSWLGTESLGGFYVSTAETFGGPGASSAEFGAAGFWQHVGTATTGSTYNANYGNDGIIKCDPSGDSVIALPPVAGFPTVLNDNGSIGVQLIVHNPGTFSCTIETTDRTTIGGTLTSVLLPPVKNSTYEVYWDLDGDGNPGQWAITNVYTPSAVSVSGSACAITAIVNGVITAATCTP